MTLVVASHNQAAASTLTEYYFCRSPVTNSKTI